MKILVTGGAGFIGSHIVDAYISLGHTVAVMDNLSSGKTEYINPQAKFFQVDITNLESVQKAISDFKPEVINHHAAHIQVGYSVKNPQFDATSNILGLLNIMESVKSLGLKKVIMASTGGVIYGNKQVPFDEEMREEPLSPYGISKKSGELYLYFYHKEYKIPYTVLRYSNVYGPRQNPHGESGVIAIFCEYLAAGKSPVINGDGSHTRDYVYIEDVVRANVLALESDFVGELNIGTNTETSTSAVFDIVASEFGAPSAKQFGPERPGEQARSALSYQKAKKILGWTPTVTLQDGVKNVARWYQGQRRG